MIACKWRNRLMPSFSNLLRATVIASAVAVTPLHAQEAVDVDALITEVEAGCAADSGSCAAIMRTALTRLRAAGVTLPPATLNAQIAAVVTRVAAVALNLPVAQRAGISAAVRVAADPEVGFTGAAEEIATQLAAVEAVASSIEAGGDVPPEIVAQLGSAA
jgi:hypothetical protein